MCWDWVDLLPRAQKSPRTFPTFIFLCILNNFVSLPRVQETEIEETGCTNKRGFGGECICSGNIQVSPTRSSSPRPVSIFTPLPLSKSFFFCQILFYLWSRLGFIIGGYVSILYSHRTNFEGRLLTPFPRFPQFRLESGI